MKHDYTRDLETTRYNKDVVGDILSNMYTSTISVERAYAALTKTSMLDVTGLNAREIIELQKALNELISNECKHDSPAHILFKLSSNKCYLTYPLKQKLVKQ